MSRRNAAAGMPPVHPALSQANQAVFALQQQHQTAYDDLKRYTDGEIYRLVRENFGLETSNEELAENIAQAEVRCEGLVKEKDSLHARVVKEQQEVERLRRNESALEAQLSKEVDDATKFRIGTVVILAESRRDLLRLRKENAELAEDVTGADSNCEWFRDELTRSTEAAEKLKKEQVVRAAELTNERGKLVEEHARKVAKLKQGFKGLKAQYVADAAAVKHEAKRLTENFSAKATQAVQEVGQLREEKHAVEEDLFKEQTATESLQTQLEESKQQVALLRAKVDTQSDARTDLQEAHDKLLAAGKELQADHTKTRNSLAQSEEDKSRLDKVLHQERETHREKLDDLAYHQKATPELQDAIAILETQVAAAKSLLARQGPRLGFQRRARGVLMHWFRCVQRVRLVDAQTKLVETETQLTAVKHRYTTYKKAVLSVTQSMDESERTPVAHGSGESADLSVAIPTASEAVQQTIASSVNSDHGGHPPTTEVSPKPNSLALSGPAAQNTALYADHRPAAPPLGFPLAFPNIVPLGLGPETHQSATLDRSSSRGNKRPGPPRCWDDRRPRGPKCQKRSADDQRRDSRW